jgi:hypothetical protein
VSVDSHHEGVETLRLQLSQSARSGAAALQELDLESIQRLQQNLSALEALARESFQAWMHEVYESLADRLERGEQLEDRELTAIELLFTGAARYYLKTENNFHDWIAELQRLVAELGAVGDAGIDRIADLMHVQALCRDALHVMPEVVHYLHEQERVELFRENITGRLTREHARMLARLIRDLMASPDR